MTSNTTQLEEAKQKLEELRSELPRYYSLLTDTQQHEVELQRQFRAGTGKFSDLTNAKNSTLTAKELLEQHQADIETARQDVERLQEAVDREKERSALIALAREANKRMAALDRETAKLNDLILERCRVLLEHKTAVDEAKQAFTMGLTKLGFRVVDFRTTDEQERELRSFLQQLEHEVDLAAVTAINPSAPRHAYWQHATFTELPQPFGRYLLNDALNAYKRRDMALDLGAGLERINDA